jgi:hypothetical protein
MLSWSTSGIGREKANQEFQEYKEFGSSGVRRFTNRRMGEWANGRCGAGSGGWRALDFEDEDDDEDEDEDEDDLEGEAAPLAIGYSRSEAHEQMTDRGGWRSDVGMSSRDHFKTFEYRRLQIRQDGQKITAGFSSLAIRLASYGSHYPHGQAV